MVNMFYNPTVQNFSTRIYVFQKELQKSIMRSFVFIFLFFILTEILVIVAVSNVLGFGKTFILLVTSTVLGIWMCRSASLRSFNHAKMLYVQGVTFDNRLLGSAGTFFLRVFVDDSRIGNKLHRFNYFNPRLKKLHIS